MYENTSLRRLSAKEFYTPGFTHSEGEMQEPMFVERVNKIYTIPDVIPQTTASNSRVVDLSMIERKLIRREELVQEIEGLKKEVTEIEDLIKRLLGAEQYAESNLYRVSYENIVSHRLNTKKLKNDRPDIYEAFVSNINSRRLQIRAKKGTR